MRIYMNPWVSRESYFVRTGTSRSAKCEASKSKGYAIEFLDGKWKVRKAEYYNQTLAEMPIISESATSIQAIIDKAIISSVLSFVNAEKMDEGAENG